MTFLFKNHLEYDHRQMELEPETLCQMDYYYLRSSGSLEKKQ